MLKITAVLLGLVLFAQSAAAADKVFSEDQKIAIRLIEKLESQREEMLKLGVFTEVQSLSEAIDYIRETVHLKRSFPPLAERREIAAALNEMNYLAHPATVGEPEVAWEYHWYWFEGEVIGDVIGGVDREGPPGRVRLDAFTAAAVAEKYKREKEAARD